MATTTPTSGPQIQDFKVRNAIDQITTGLNTVENTVSQLNVGRELLSTGATASSQVTLADAGLTVITSGFSLANSTNSLVTVATTVVNIIAALRTAKLMR